MREVIFRLIGVVLVAFATGGVTFWLSVAGAEGQRSIDSLAQR